MVDKARPAESGQIWAEERLQERMPPREAEAAHPSSDGSESFPRARTYSC